MRATLYHNPACFNSRTCLKLLRQAGADITIVEYLKTPLGKAGVEALAARLKATAGKAWRVRDMVRVKEPVFDVLFGWDAIPSEADLLDAMAAHPILINRPIVTTPKGTKLCRPPDVVRELL